MNEEESTTLEWLDGYQEGYVNGFDQGLSFGRQQGYDDVVYQIKRFAGNALDPEIDTLLKEITGEY